MAILPTANTRHSSSRLSPEPLLPYLRGTQQTPKRNVISALSHRGAITPIPVRKIVKSCRSCFFFAPWCDDADGCNNADGCAGPHDYGNNLESTTDCYLPESRRRAVKGPQERKKEGTGGQRTHVYPSRLQLRNLRCFKTASA